MRSNRIVILLERLYKLDEQLGGNERKKNTKKPQKEFDTMIEELKEQIEMIAAKQKDRETRNNKYGNDDEAIRLGAEIRDGILACDQQLKSIEKNLLRQLKKPKKYNPQDLETRVTAFKLLKIALKGTKTKEFGIEEREFEGVSLNQLKNYVFDGKSNNQVYQDELSLEEQEAIQRWNLNDQHMDQQLDQIISGLEQLNYKAQNIGQKIDQTGAQINKVTEEVDKTNKSLANANQSLKKLIQVYRRPNKFVLDIAFILLLLGLIATIVTTFTK